MDICLQKYIKWYNSFDTMTCILSYTYINQIILLAKLNINIILDYNFLFTNIEVHNHKVILAKQKQTSS